MYNKKCPCHYCENRTVTCHGECDNYKQYRKECDELIEKQAKEMFNKRMQWRN